MPSFSNLQRPDKLLQKKLIALAYSLIALTISLILLILYPQNFIWLLAAIGTITIYCLILSITSLKAGENAINYGGFANEVIQLSSKAKRIDDPKGLPVIENETAVELFRHQKIIAFLQSNLADNRSNHLSLQRLKNAFQNLLPEKVVLSLNLKSDSGIENETWFEIISKPIILRKTDIFETPFSVNKMKKDTYMYWSFRDITAERNIEQIFQNERHYMHDFLDYLPTGLYICDENYQIEYCNHAFANILQMPREQVSGRDVRSFLSHNSETPPHNTAWNSSIYLINKSGNAIETFIKQDNFREGNKIKIRASAITNLPNDKTLDQRLNTANDQVSWLFDFAPIGIILLKPNGVVQNCNAQAAALLQDNCKNIIDINLLDLIRKSDQNTMLREFENITIGAKKTASFDIVLTKDKKAAMTYITPMKKLHDKESLEGFIIYMIDATEQKNLEIQFAQAQKMQAMGQLAGGVAHDFNNLLTAIIGFCDLLLQRHGIGDPSFADLIQVKNNANRAAGLVRQLLAFSRKQPLQPKLIDVTENFMELSQMLKRVLGERVVLKFHHGADLGFIRVDPVQFSQVIINLAVNAKDAMSGEGILSITTRVEQIKTPRQFGEDIVKPGEFVVIDVEDTGCGISKENLSRIFEPFFSTKQNVVGSGTGLGLAMVYGIVRQTEGFIKVDSELDKGTIFSIHLPRFENNAESEIVVNEKSLKNNSSESSSVITVREQSTSSLSINQKFIFGLNVSAIDKGIDSNNQQGDIKILFVEDEDSVRSFALRALKKKGYDVIACNSAENALEQLEISQDFNLLLTDVVMPGMNGVELAHKVREKIPNIKIILASGYSEEIARNELSAADDFEFMAKPFSLGDLTKKIFDVLNKE